MDTKSCGKKSSKRVGKDTRPHCTCTDSGHWRSNGIGGRVLSLHSESRQIQDHESSYCRETLVPTCRGPLSVIKDCLCQIIKAIRGFLCAIDSKKTSFLLGTLGNEEWHASGGRSFLLIEKTKSWKIPHVIALRVAQPWHSRDVSLKNHWVTGRAAISENRELKKNEI